MKTKTSSFSNHYGIHAGAILPVAFRQRAWRSGIGVAVLLAGLLLVGPGRAAQIVWTNTAGGNWSGTANWSPNQLPVTADTAVITNDGNYTVTMDVSPTIAGLVVGATTGVNTQTLLGNGQTLTLNGQVTVNSQGRFNFTGGTLAGAAILAGTMTCSGGTLNSGGSLTVAANGVLNLTGNQYIYSPLTNNGTVNWQGGPLFVYYYPGAGYYGGIWNQAGAQWNIQCDQTLSDPNYSLPTFNNAGTLTKSGSSGTTTINALFINSGILDLESGVISLTDGFDLTGGTLNFGISGAASFGKINLAGAVTLTGTLSANLNNGYLPVAGNSFGVLDYSSQTGAFANFALPAKDAWTTNYGATVFTLTVLNSAPTLPAQTNQVVNEETTLTVTNTAVDLDIPANTLSYTLLVAPANASISASGVITWTPNESQGPGTNTFTTRVADNGSPSLSDTNTFTVVVNEVNVAPVLPVLADTNVNELATLIVTNTATDHDLPANPLSYALLQAPANAVINTNGVITWTPTEAQGPSTNMFTTVVTDTNIFAVNAQSLSATNTFTVIVNEVNTAPVLTLPANQTINELTFFTNNATATDADIPANTLTFALVSGPTNLTVSPNGGISWTPSEAQGPSTNVVQIAVTDFNPWAVNAQHLSVTNTFTITVNEVNTAPVLGAMSDRTVNPGQTISFTATATDADLPTNALTFSLMAPPAGASVDSSSGLFYWRPAVAQANTTNTVQVQVVDSNPYAVNSQHLTDTKSFKVVVNPLAPVVLAPKGYVNGQFSMSVTGSVGPDYVLQGSTTLMNWVSLVTNTPGSMPFIFNDPAAGSFSNRFYRAKQQP